MIATHRRVLVAVRIGLIGASFLVGAHAKAQTSVLRDGDRVRFTLVGATVEHKGEVSEAARDSVILRSCDDCEQRRFALKDFSALSVYRLDDVHRGKRTLVGAATGFAVGLVVGGIAGRRSSSGCGDTPGCGLVAATGALTGAGIGALAGGIIGATWRPGHWERVLPVH